MVFASLDIQGPEVGGSFHFFNHLRGFTEVVGGCSAIMIQLIQGIFFVHRLQTAQPGYLMARPLTCLRGVKFPTIRRGHVISVIFKNKSYMNYAQVIL